MRLPAVIKDRLIQRNFDFLSSRTFDCVEGSISAAGAILSGTGFTVAKIGVGQYTITFNKPFVAAPRIVYGTGTTGANYTVKSTAKTTSTVTVNTFTIAAAPANVDGEFDFRASL